MIKVVIAHALPDQNIEQRYLPADAVVEFRYSPTEEELIKNCKDADAIITSSEPVTRRVIHELTNCKIIAKESIGYDNIDVKAAAEKNIAVTNLPTYCVNEVADHVLALILALNRNLIAYHRSVQNREWKYDLCKGMVRLDGQILGLVGFGNIARQVAKRAQGFGIKAIAYDKFPNAAVAKSMNVELVTFDEILEHADIISAHLPLTKDTTGLFSKAVFSQMKKRPVFINAARGGVVVEEDLIAALDKGIVSAAGIDVLSSEEPELEKCGLLGRDNVIVTPHMAFYSDTSLYDMRKLSALSITNYLNGELDKVSIVNGVGKK